MDIRSLDLDDPIFEEQDVDKDFIGENWPVTMKFFPSEEVQIKLINRMLQLEKLEYESELWQGFKTMTTEPIDDNQMLK